MSATSACLILIFQLLTALSLLQQQLVNAAAADTPNNCQDDKGKPIKGGTEFCIDDETEKEKCAQIFGYQADATNTATDVKGDLASEPATDDEAGVLGKVTTKGTMARPFNKMRSKNCDVDVTAWTKGKTYFESLRKKCRFTCATCCDKEEYKCDNLAKAERVFGSNLDCGNLKTADERKTIVDKCPKLGDTSDKQSNLMGWYCPATCGLCKDDMEKRKAQAMKDYPKPPETPPEKKIPPKSGEQQKLSPKVEEYFKKLLESLKNQEKLFADRLPKQDAAVVDLVHGVDKAVNCGNITHLCDAFYYRELMNRECAKTCRDYFENRVSSDDYSSYDSGDYSDEDYYYK